MPTALVGGIPGAGRVVHKVGTFKAGQQKVGFYAGPSAFGTPTFTVAPPFTAVLGVPSAQAFGSVTIKGGIAIPVGGVNSAQAFGAPTIKSNYRVAAVGIPSAQAFGSPRVYLLYVSPSPPLDLLLIPTSPGSLVLTGSVAVGGGLLVPTAPGSGLLVPTDEDDLLLTPTVPT